MKISELIRRLEQIRDQYGNLPIYHQHDSVEYEPKVEILKTRFRQMENYEIEEVPAETRVVIH